MAGGRIGLQAIASNRADLSKDGAPAKVRLLTRMSPTPIKRVSLCLLVWPSLIFDPSGPSP